MNNDLPKNKELYMELERRTSQARIREGMKRDHLILTITAGTLVISVTFLVNLISKATLVFVPVLLVSWICLVASIILMLLGFIFVDFHFIIRKKELYKAYKTATLEDDIEAYNKSNAWVVIAMVADYAAVLFSIIGIILFAWFGMSNIRHIQSLHPDAEPASLTSSREI